MLDSCYHIDTIGHEGTILEANNVGQRQEAARQSAQLQPFSDDLECG